MKSKLDREILAEIEGYELSYHPSTYWIHKIKHRGTVVVYAGDKVEVLEMIRTLKEVFGRKIKPKE